METGPWEALAQEFLCPFRLARAKERAELQIPVSPLCGPLVGSFPHSLFPRLLAGCGGACSDRTGAGWNETECHTVCLKNLPWWARDSDVEKLASSFGAIALSQHRSSRTPKSRHHLRFACMRQRACMRLQGSSSSFALSTSRVTANPPASCASQTAARPFLQPHACVHTLHCAPVRRRSRAWKPARSALTCCGARRYVSYASAYEALAARDAIDGRSHSMRIAPLRTCRRRARMAWRLRWPLSFVCFLCFAMGLGVRLRTAALGTGANTDD